jgi:hypothetical protein
MITMDWILSRESKVYRTVCNLTAIMVLVHMLLGCCWHHHHTSPGEPARAMCVDPAGVDCHCPWCGHERGCPHQPASGGHQGASGCEGSRCVFATEQPSRAPTASTAELSDVAPVGVAVDNELPAESSISARALAATRASQSPRIHLWQQVLLL